jgi:phospholipase C
VLALPLAVAAAGPASGLATAGTSAGQSPAGHAAAVRSSDTLPSAVRSSAGRSSAGQRLVFVRAAGGSGKGRLTDPFGVAAGPGGDVWVADRGSNRIVEFSPAGKLITVLAPAGAGALAGPEGVAVSAAGRVWVADTGHNRLEELSARGKVLAVAGQPGSGRGQLSRPAAVASTRSGDVYAADQGNSRVVEFSPSGAYLRSFAVATPDGVAIGAAGDVWVSSPGYANDNATGDVAGNTVREFSPAGAAIRSFGVTQSSYGALSNPAGLAVGPAGQVYVAQPDYGWVTVFSPAGRYAAEFGLPSGPGAGREGLAFPEGLAVTVAGQVWVADSGNGRVAEYAPPGPAAAQPPVAAPPAGLPGARSGLPWPVWLLLAILILVLLLVARGSRARRQAAAGRGTASGGKAAPGSGTAADGTAAGTTDPAAGAASASAAAAAGLGVTRRRILGGSVALAGGALAGAGALPLSLRTALAATLASPPRGRLSDIKHIVILMQENRSFDHYFGALPGVRGFADPAAIRLPGGKSVFYQPDPAHPQGYLLPFRLDTATTSAQGIPSTDHFWPSQHQAFANGRMDAWVAAKGPLTMGYFTRDDIPFHWALADAFTICDRYHCSVLGPTNPNRLYMWTGMIDPAGTGGGPVIDDSPGFDNVTLSWTTYPERLQRAGISWQVYQEEDNFDDNALAWFKQYAKLPSTSPLYQRGMAARPAGTFEDDARSDRLPQVSWLVAPTAQSEHPDYYPAAGAEYIAQKLDAIASNPDVWAKTAFILCYDENDGLFDHVPPPTPPRGTPGEFAAGLPIGLGFRVPALVISPWTVGGHVNSGLFDHTSLIRLIEARFGVREPNISAWRRRTCGDLTSVFRFSAAPARYPRANAGLRLASTEASLLAAQREVSSNPSPAIPAVNQPLPSQRGPR